MKKKKKTLIKVPTSIIVLTVNDLNTSSKRQKLVSRLKKVGQLYAAYWCGEKATLLHYWWECKLVQPLWRTVWRFLKKLKIELPYDPANPTPGHISREKHGSKGYMHSNVHCSTVYNNQDIEATLNVHQ